MRRNTEPFEIDPPPSMFAGPANGVGFTTPTWLGKFVVAMIGFILVSGTTGIYRSVRETECLHGNANACRIAKQYWGFDDPKCPDGCTCIGPHHTPICGDRTPKPPSWKLDIGNW